MFHDGKYAERDMLIQAVDRCIGHVSLCTEAVVHPAETTLQRYMSRVQPGKRAARDDDRDSQCVYCL